MTATTHPVINKKTVVEVEQSTHAGLVSLAEKTGNSLKATTSLLLDFAMAKVDDGAITFRKPSVEEIIPTA